MSPACSHREVLHMYALIGASDHSGEPQDWKKMAAVFRKRKEERKSNIFSPNYSVGTVLCTVECPGSGVAWWVNAGAKPHPPHIVLSVDFLHSVVPMSRTSALPLPSSVGADWLTARSVPRVALCPRSSSLVWAHVGVRAGAGSVPPRCFRLPGPTASELRHLAVDIQISQPSRKPQPMQGLWGCTPAVDTPASCIGHTP